MELSDEKYHQENFVLLEETLLRNNYPLNVVKKCVNETIIEVNTQGPKNQKEMIKAYVTVPYAPPVFNKLKLFLKGYGITVAA